MAGPRVIEGLGGLRGKDGPAWAVSLLPFSHIFFNRKEIRERKTKRRLGKDFAHGDNIPRLAKMCMVQEKWSGHFSKFKYKLI